MNHADPLGAKQLFTPLRFRCQQVFSFRESFFSRPRRGNSLARRRRMSHFQTRVKNFFAIRENFLPRRPCGHGQFVGANGFMRLFGHTVKHFPAKNFADLPVSGGLSYQHTGKTQKNVGIFSFRHHPHHTQRPAAGNTRMSPPCLQPHASLRDPGAKRQRCPRAPWQAHLPASQIARPARRPLSANPCSTALQGAASPQTARIRTAPSRP